MFSSRRKVTDPFLRRSGLVKGGGVILDIWSSERLGRSERWSGLPSRCEARA